jgi:hypothetical protein
MYCLDDNQICTGDGVLHYRTDHERLTNRFLSWEQSGHTLAYSERPQAGQERTLSANANGVEMKVKLSKDQLLQLLHKLMNPKAYGLSETTFNDVLLDFCAGCREPVRARWLIVECLDPLTDEELVDRALAMPLRMMKDVPPSEFPSGHPLRAIAQ